MNGSQFGETLDRELSPGQLLGFTLGCWEAHLECGPQIAANLRECYVII